MLVSGFRLLISNAWHQPETHPAAEVSGRFGYP
jgi:hypothetical protein